MSRFPALPPIQTQRPYALSIAGLDPCGGAGILADAKVFEASGVYGLGVCTALTMQHDADFRAVEWVALKTIVAQCVPLVERYPISVVKIGLIESMTVLADLLDWLTEHLPGIPLIWDPILKASAGFGFHELTNRNPLTSVLSRLALITPNIPETMQLAGIGPPLSAAETLSNHCPVYLKGGHAEPTQGIITDYLLTDGAVTASFPAIFVPNGEKHGSGCVLSSAIAAGLAKRQCLPDACTTARGYISRYLASTPTLLGFHNVIL